MNDENINRSGIVGYKAFYRGLINTNRKKFEVGKKYVIEDKYKDYNGASKLSYALLISKN